MTKEGGLVNYDESMSRGGSGQLRLRVGEGSRSSVSHTPFL